MLINGGGKLKENGSGVKIIFYILFFFCFIFVFIKSTSSNKGKKEKKKWIIKIMIMMKRNESLKVLDYEMQSSCCYKKKK